MEPCTDCEKAHKTKMAEARNSLIKLAAKTYKDKDFITLALVETKNGKLGIREQGDESLSRLKVVEFISIVQGVASVPVY